MLLDSMAIKDRAVAGLQAIRVAMGAMEEAHLQLFRQFVRLGWWNNINDKCKLK